MQRAGDVHGAVCATLAVVRIASTEQIARVHFASSCSPIKRASECLVRLSNQKVVEGEMTGFGRPKVWRLTKRAREERGLVWRPPVLVTRKTAHWLALTECYLQLCIEETPLIWHPEYREHIEDDVVFAPDVWMVWRRKPCFLEVQLSELSSQGWRLKWLAYQKYYDLLDKRRVQPEQPARPVKPIVIVKSHQQVSTIGGPAGVSVVKWSDFSRIGDVR